VFDDVLRGLNRMATGQVVQVKVSLDDDGYYDRSCPASECGTAFKVLFADWRDKVPDERAFCAVCGELAEPSAFNTEAQNRYLQQQAIAHIQGQLDDVFRRATPRTQRTGFLEMTLTYRPGARPVILPASAAPILQQRSECEACGCRYASLGAAFFCPACGHNSAKSTLAGALATVRASMDLAERLPTMLDDDDEAADIGRHMSEDGLVRLWSSFQRFAEATYATHPASTTAPARRNAFQNLEDSDRLWSGATGKTYASLLTVEEHRDLVRLVQMRHVLAHKDGIVDADYVSRSGDPLYRVGQRLVVTPSATRLLANIVESLAGQLTGVATPVATQAPLDVTSS
jgi:hypothetical protein